MKYRIKIIKKRSGETSYYPQYSYSINILGIRKWKNYLALDRSWKLSFGSIERAKKYLDKTIEYEKRAILHRRNDKIASTKYIKYP